MADIRNIINANPVAQAAYLAEDNVTCRSTLNDRHIKVLNNPSLNRLDPGYTNQRAMIQDLQVIDPINFPDEDTAINYAALFFEALTDRINYYEALVTPTSNEKRRFGELETFRARWMTSSVDFAYQPNRKVINVDITTPWNALLTPTPDDPINVDYLDKSLLFDLGFQMKSEAEQSINRQVTNSDINESRQLDVDDAAAAAQAAADAAAAAAALAIRNDYINAQHQKAGNALSAYQAKWQADISLDPEVYWDAAKQATEWALAWSNA